MIINKGKIVATDTPDALTQRFHGTVMMFVQVDGPADDVLRTLHSIPGVVRASVKETRGNVTNFDIDTQPDVDLRREVAAAVVRGGWGLLELRPVRMSLEDIFLSLTTTETETEDLEAEKVVADA